VKFHRLILAVSAAMGLSAGVAHWAAGNVSLTIADFVFVLVIGVFWIALRYPTRLVFRVAAGALGITSVALAIAAYRVAIQTTWPWSILGAATSVALLGSVTLAMVLGHWYLVVRGMPIDPLKRLAWASLTAAICRTVVVTVSVALLSRHGMAFGTAARALLIGDGVFFWMRVGWGLVVPLALYPMIWGTVKIRSTMAATGILYVAVVAVVIGEVLGSYLSAVHAIAV